MVPAMCAHRCHSAPLSPLVPATGLIGAFNAECTRIFATGVGAVSDCLKAWRVFALRISGSEAEHRRAKGDSRKD